MQRGFNVRYFSILLRQKCHFLQCSSVVTLVLGSVTAVSQGSQKVSVISVSFYVISADLERSFKLSVVSKQEGKLEYLLDVKKF